MMHRVERGQSMVELALVTPFLIMLLLVAADGARAFSAYIAIGNAAREGASYASRTYDAANDEARIMGAVHGESGEIFGTLPVVESLRPDEGCEDDYGYDCVRVTVHYEFQPLFDFPGLPGTIDLQRSAQMRILEV